jgi:U3 small nucleolar RNA-associated protein 13
VKTKKVASYCLYLDEVIDIKFIKPENDFAVVCSNSETLKLVSLKSSQIELYSGHSDIILCLDVSPSTKMILSGAKDNTIRLW